MSADNRQLVTAFHAALWEGRFDAARACLGAGYVEHQYHGGFTFDGVTADVLARRARHPRHRVILHQVLSEDSLVFAFAQEIWEEGVDHALADLYRIDAGRIVEHWHSRVLDEKNRKNGNGTFDGMSVDRSVDHARRAAVNFEALDDRAFNAHDIDAFHISRSPAYRQHSPKGGDGITGLVAVLSGAKQRGLAFSARRLHTLCDGDLLVSHRLYGCTPAAPLMNHHTFDVFRIDAGGRAVEHWDVMDDDLPPAPLIAKMT